MKTIEKSNIYLAVDKNEEKLDYTETMNLIGETLRKYLNLYYGPGTSAKIEINMEIYIPDKRKPFTASR